MPRDRTPDEICRPTSFRVAQASENSGSNWSVRFAEDAEAPLVIDAGSDMYDQQVEEQMAAAAALVRKLQLTSARLDFCFFVLSYLSVRPGFRRCEQGAAHSAWIQSISAVRRACGHPRIRYRHAGQSSRSRFGSIERKNHAVPAGSDVLLSNLANESQNWHRWPPNLQ